jgi:NADPH2:quinone reductase
MRAIAITEFGDRNRLQLIETPIPDIADDEVLVRVKAAGVNPVDWKIRRGLLVDRLPHEFPLIPGWDVAGVIELTGRKADYFSIGDEVYAYCRKALVRDGAYAEYIALRKEHAALKPRNMSFAEAATVPLAALTAWQSLYDCARLRKGETVLIHAAAGGVGGFAVQLAKARGATVFGTASGSNHDHLRGLGVDQPIDYTACDFREPVKSLRPHGVDVVLDCVGEDTLTRSADILSKTGGRLVSIVSPDAVRKLRKEGVNAHYVFVAPDSGELARIARMIEEGLLRTTVCAFFPLEDAALAHELSESGHVRGKIVLTV